MPGPASTLRLCSTGSRRADRRPCRTFWKQDADRSFQLLREKNDELAEDLSPWFTDNFITLLFRDGVELRTLAFLSTIAQLADMETPMLSVLAFVATDGTKQEFLLA